MRRTLLLLLVASCHAPPSAERDAAASPVSSACTQIGAQCMFAPGKLGTCVEVEPTSGPATLVCQSQH